MPICGRVFAWAHGVPVLRHRGRTGAASYTSLSTPCFTLLRVFCVQHNGGLLKVAANFIAAAELLVQPKANQIALAREADVVVPLTGLGWSLQVHGVTTLCLGCYTVNSTASIFPPRTHTPTPTPPPTPRLAVFCHQLWRPPGDSKHVHPRALARLPPCGAEACRLVPPPTSYSLCLRLQADLYNDASRQLATSQGSFVVVFSASFTSVFTVAVFAFLLPMVGVLARQLRRKRALLLLMPGALVAGLQPLRLLVKEVVVEAEAMEGVAASTGSTRRRQSV